MNVMTMDYRPHLSLQGTTSYSADEFPDMSDFADCSEDELMNITFEACKTKDTGTVLAPAFIKYVEDVTGYNHENSKLLLLYNMLDPERQNVLIDRETFLATMKKWITICCGDCIPETEVDESQITTNGNLQHNDMMSSFSSNEDAEIFEGRPEDSEMTFDLNSSVENLKYTSHKMTEKLLGMQKVMEASEETCLQLADDIEDLRGKLTSMQKLLEKFRYIYTELEDVKSKTANLHEENHVICECVTRLKKQVDSLTTKLISLEENSKTSEEKNTSYESLLSHLWNCFQNLLHEIKSQKNSMFQALMEENPSASAPNLESHLHFWTFLQFLDASAPGSLQIALKQKMGHSLLTVVQTFASLCSFITAWNRILRRLDKFLDGQQLLAKSDCLNSVGLHETEELGEMNDCPKQSTLEAEIQASSMTDDCHCLFGRAKMNAPKGNLEGILNKTALRTEDSVSFNSQLLPQTEEKDQILYHVWKKMLEVGWEWENPEVKLEVVLETAKSLAKAGNDVLDEKQESNKYPSQHKMQPEHRKRKSIAAGKLKESSVRILGELCESIPESHKLIQQIIKVFHLWISEDEGSVPVPDYSKETKDSFEMEKKMSFFTQSAEQISFDDFSQCDGSLVCLENKLPDCFSVVQQCSVHQTSSTTDDEKYSRQEEITLDMKSREPSKEAAACCESRPVSPVCFSSSTSSAIHYLDCNNSIVETSLIEALNLEGILSRRRCCWTFPNLLLPGQRPASRESFLNKRRHVHKTEHGGNNKRTLEVNSQVSTGDEVKYFGSAPLPDYSAVTQRTSDQKAFQIFSSEVNLKHIFPSVHGLFSPHYNPTWCSVPIMPTLPEDVGQPAETHHSILPPTDKEPPAEVAISNTPAIVLPENTVIQDAERERTLSLRPISPYLRHSNRHTRASDTSLTSIDNTGHVIDLVNDQLPDDKISDEDKKKNLELLEEAKRVSERFLTRRGRRSRSSLSESPTGLSPMLSPHVSPAPSRSNSFNFPSPAGSPDTCSFTVGSLSPLQNATKGLNDRNQNDQRKLSQGRLLPRLTSFENPKEKLSEQKENFDPHKLMDNLSRSCASVSDVGRVTLNSSTNTCEPELGKPFLKITKENDFPFKGNLQGPGMATVEPKLKGLVPLLKDSKVTSKTELTTPATHPPLLRSISWDHVEPGNIEMAPFKQPSDYDKNVAIMNKFSNTLTKPSTFKDLQIQVQPVRMQKLTKIREEHILLRNQNLVGLKLPDLSEAAEQERGSSPSLLEEEEEEEEEEAAENSRDVMPNIPDALLRKLRVHTSLPGSSPPLTEKEVENVFTQLSLAFRNDSYTLESRINQAERERNLAEENTEKELDHFKVAITCMLSLQSSASLWHHSEHREMYQKLLEDITVLHRLASRLSSRAEMVGAVRQEKRMSKATEVMMQYVENLKRTYEKDHAELMEYKKLANQNSSRSYGSPEDGVPRTSRSMSLTVGKAPRRRVSVAVVSKFEIPGQSPSISPIPLMPSLTESTNGRNNLTTTPVLPALLENGKSNGDHDCEPPPSVPAQSGMEEISPEIKTKIEEEAYNKGYQEGLKKARELELIEDDEEKIVEGPNECEEGESDDEICRHSKIEVVIHYIQILYPKLQKHWTVLWIAAAIVIIFAVILGISSLYSHFSSCAELSDGQQVKATCPAAQQYSWWHSGLHHDQHTE